MDEQVETFGERLEILRIERGLNQEDFAALLGIDQPAYSRYKTMNRNPKLVTMRKFSSKLKISIAWLSGQSKNQHEPPKPEDLSDESLELVRLFEQDKTGNSAIRFILDTTQARADEAAKRSKAGKSKNNASNNG